VSVLVAGEATSVVRVEHVHRSAPALRHQAGEEVTVIWQAGRAPEDENGRLVFFTDPVLFGETVAVREVGHVPEPDDREALHALLEGVGDEIEMATIRSHADEADVIVFGVVTSTHASSDISEIPSSEHDPRWWVAHLEVGEALKGDPGDDDLRVRFPSSRDVRWYRVPKLYEGLEAVFLLHRDGLEIDGVTLAIVHPGDVIEEHEQFRGRAK
jgi:L-rhamnose mutarotase